MAYGIAAGLGVLVFLAVYGPAHLFGTSPYWDMPQEDSRAYLMAYRYFLHEPWHWPLFTTYTINIPDTKSLALSDGLPLWALINKAIATVVPPWGTFSERSYLGTWHLLVHVLQASFGVAILRQLGHRSRGAAIVTAVFFLALPSWIFRYQHAALSAHFLILWPIYLYLRTPPGQMPPRRVQLAWLGELAICAMTNPYHVVMSLGLLGAALVRARKAKALVWLPAALATVVVAAGLTGYLSRATATKMGGFEIYTTNMMSMFVPPNSGILGDTRGWFGDEIPIHNQYEGLTYIGLGLLGLCVAFLPRLRSLGGVIRNHPGLFAVAFGAWVFALSTRIYFNSHLVISYPFPAKLHFIQEWFRAPGRFAYVPMYVLVVFVLHRGLARFQSTARWWVIPLLAVLQLVDATGQWRVQHSYTRDTYPHTLEREPWRALVHAHRTILELPTYDCLGDDWTKLKPALELAYYASERAIPINGVYGARPVRDCTEDERRFPTEPVDGTLYVWFTKSDRFPRRLVSRGATCGTFAFGWACSLDHGAIETAIANKALGPMTSSAAEAPFLAYGQPIVFGTGGDPRFLLHGWSYPENGGQWSDGPVSTLHVRLKGDPPPRVGIALSMAGVVCGKRKTQDVDVLVNDHPVGTLHFDAANNDPAVPRILPIEDLTLLTGSEVFIDLKPRDVRPPSSVRCNDDARRLGVWLRQVEFTSAP